MTLTIGFSPCPNDTFIFDALVHGGIDTGSVRFEPVLADVETLNQWALEGKLDITKLSFPALFRATEKYVLLESGSALGKGVGPLLITTPEKFDAVTAAPEDAVIVLPGLHTTANLLFSFAFPGCTHKNYQVFSSIEDAVLQGSADAGVIIHENRFTYQQRGLKKITDLGEYWEIQTGLPIPLGGIAAKRSLPADLVVSVSNWIRQSLEKSFAAYPQVSPYVREHAQEMDENVMRSHIDLYVNDYSLALGEAGHEAILKLQQVFRQLHNIKADSGSSLFL